MDCAEGIGIQTSHTGYSLIAENLAIGLIEPFAARAWRNNGMVARPFHPAVTFDYVIAYSVFQQRTEPLKTFANIIRGIATV